MTDPQPRTAPTSPARRPYRRPRFGLWIGLGFLVGLAIGLFVAATTNGPALVSAQRSYLWLGMVLGSFGALLGALAAVVAEAVVNRGR